MIITNDLFELEDQVENLVEAILSSKVAVLYKENKLQLMHSKDVQDKKSKFLEAKNAFEQIEHYGKVAPNFREKQRALRQAKRAMDLTEELAEFRYAETNIQLILDSVGSQIAQAISEEIKVDSGNPFFEKEGTAGCGGGCHAR